MTRARTCEIRRVCVDLPDVLYLLDAYFAELRARVPKYEPPSLDELHADGERGVTLVSYEDGVAVGCGAIRLFDATTAEIKRMFVLVEARGRGHARRLLVGLEDEARSLGVLRIVLDTAAPLHEAAAMYLREGYVEIARYNDNPAAARWFEKQLVRST
jgi:GNAT superfamily N-acetyltransferase